MSSIDFGEERWPYPPMLCQFILFSPVSCFSGIRISLVKVEEGISFPYLCSCYVKIRLQSLAHMPPFCLAPVAQATIA